MTAVYSIAGTWHTGYLSCGHSQAPNRAGVLLKSGALRRLKGRCRVVLYLASMTATKSALYVGRERAGTPEEVLTTRLWSYRGATAERTHVAQRAGH